MHQRNYFILLACVLLIGCDAINLEIPTSRSVTNATLVTLSVTDITDSTAICGGNITNDGGSKVTSQGVCWSQSVNPTLMDSVAQDKSGSSPFSCKLTHLKGSTTYYVRAFATNAKGTSYGNQVSFTTQAIKPPTTVTDVDGNVYKIVTIGTQTWMAQNLRVTHYRNGEQIPTVADSVAWCALTAGAMCTHANITHADTISKYGRLYNWYAVNDSRLIAPVGWHVASDAEWSTLITYMETHFGTSQNVAKALSSTTDWSYDATAGAVGNNPAINNYSGFDAYPVGLRNSNSGNFEAFGANSFFWTSSEVAVDVYSFGVFRATSSDNTLTSGNIFKGYGMHVRCVKD
jgi:uncharacterized protein (TIGR02145 family)